MSASPSRDHVQALRNYVADAEPVKGRHRRVPLLMDHLMILGRVVFAFPAYAMPAAVLATLQAVPDWAWERAEALAARHDELMTRAALEQAEMLALVAGTDDAETIARAEWSSIFTADRVRCADQLGCTWITRPPRRPRPAR